MLGIIAALAWEADLLQQWQKKSPLQALISCSGVGPDAAAKAAAELVQQGATTLLSFGCCGGLQASLQTGDIIIADRVTGISAGGQQYSNSAINAAAVAMLQQKISAQSTHLTVKSGTLLSVSNAVTSVVEKQRLAQQHQAVAVDMESAAILQIAEQANISGLVLRTVLDGLKQPLPVQLLQCCNAFGRVKPGRLLAALARQPALLGQLWRLASAQRSAANRLRQALLTLDEELVNIKFK